MLFVEIVRIEPSWWFTFFKILGSNGAKYMLNRTACNIAQFEPKNAFRWNCQFFSFCRKKKNSYSYTLLILILAVYYKLILFPSSSSPCQFIIFLHQIVKLTTDDLRVPPQKLFLIDFQDHRVFHFLVSDKGRGSRQKMTKCAKREGVKKTAILGVT